MWLFLWLPRVPVVPLRKLIIKQTIKVMTNEQKQTILDQIRQQAIIELEQQVDEDCITEFDEADIEQTINNLIDDCPDLIEPILEDVLGDVDDYEATINEVMSICDEYLFNKQ